MSTNDKFPPSLSRADLVTRLADQCVKCALCLPYCPTYELTEDENESPRGRIALFQALSTAQLALSDKAKKHLDQCLGCRECERVCPAHVEYGKLLVEGRTFINETPIGKILAKPPFASRFIRWLILNPKIFKAFHWLLWGLEQSHLRQLAQWFQLPRLFQLKPLDALLNTIPKPLTLKTHFSALSPQQGTVMLFHGCLTTLADQQTLLASIYVLRKLGFDVLLPSQQQCCGAMSLHAGHIKQAHQLAKKNQLAFAGGSLPIISLATGCSAVLHDLPHYFSLNSDSNNDAINQFSARSQHIMDFVQNCDWPSQISLQPLEQCILLHTPCTYRNVLKSADSVTKLLSQIPKLKIVTFQKQHCCGAAGTYMLEHPHLADPLANLLLSELNSTDANALVSTNIGCALHFQKQLSILNSGVEVLHPIVLIAHALGFDR